MTYKEFRHKLTTLGYKEYTYTNRLVKGEEGEYIFWKFGGVGWKFGGEGEVRINYIIDEKTGDVRQKYGNTIDEVSIERISEIGFTGETTIVMNYSYDDCIEEIVRLRLGDKKILREWKIDELLEL